MTTKTPRVWHRNTRRISIPPERPSGLPSANAGAFVLQAPCGRDWGSR